MLYRPARCVWLVVVLAAGCARPADVLVVATTWPESDRHALADQFEEWSEQATAQRVPIAWVSVRPGQDLGDVLDADAGVDAVLGGSETAFWNLAESHRLATVERPGLPGWLEVRRLAVGMAMNPGALRDDDRGAAPTSLARLAQRGAVAIDDPRDDPATAAIVRARLEAGDWLDGYADLLRSMGLARPVGWKPGAAVASFERGEAAFAVATFAEETDTSPFAVLPLPEPAAIVEGVGVSTRARHGDWAQAFVKFLAERRGAVPPAERPAVLPRVATLTKDLLGATLVDAQEELRAATTAVAKTSGGRREDLNTLMTEPPPWPPASVDLIRHSPEPEPLETLAAEILPDREARVWLLESWNASSRPIDGKILEQLATALEGRVADEPRFRAWLRAEWTAWARQRYQMVVQMAGEPAS